LALVTGVFEFVGGVYANCASEAIYGKFGEQHARVLVCFAIDRHMNNKKLIPQLNYLAEAHMLNY